MPLAHDALSARLIERAGFSAFAIGGSAMLAARFGLPDIGLAALGDMVEGIRDIAAATGLPFMADGDDGYGDVKSVAYTVERYELLGVGGILFEDQQRDGKQQRADRAREVADRGVIERKLRAALASRASPDTLIIGRTDALGVLGIEEALARGKRFLDVGCDGVFVAGIRTMADFERVGNELRGATLLSAALFDTSGMPWPDPKTLAELGFNQVSFPASLIFRVTDAMSSALEALRRHVLGIEPMRQDPGANRARERLDDAVRLAHWQRVEADFSAEAAVAHGERVTR